MMQYLTKKINNRKGFTLIELIVVIAILGILALIAIPRLAGFTDRADRSAAEADARTILTAASALLASDDAVTVSNIEDLTGSLEGDITVGPTVNDNDISFTYVVGKWTVVVTNGDIAAATQSGS